MVVLKNSRLSPALSMWITNACHYCVWNYTHVTLFHNKVLWTTQRIKYGILSTYLFVDKPNFDLMTDALKTQCIWEEHPRNITALLSGYPQPSVSWTRGDGASITPSEAYKIFFEPYWENGRRDEWMANLEVCSLFHFYMCSMQCFCSFLFWCLGRSIRFGMSSCLLGSNWDERVYRVCFGTSVIAHIQSKMFSRFSLIVDWLWVGDCWLTRFSKQMSQF